MLLLGVQRLAAFPRLLALPRVSLRLLSTRSVSSTAPRRAAAVTPHQFSPAELEAARLARAQSLAASPFTRHLPAKLAPYAELMRLDKPVGTWLLYLPCTWAITMAAFQASVPLGSTLWMLGVFGVGLLVMRGAGCTINDLLDRDLDNKVARTIERPIASGRVLPKAAVAFLGGQMAVGLMILLQLPLDCFLLGASSLVLVGTYPLFKRFTYYPQVVLLACFNWGVLLGGPALGVWDYGVMASLYVLTFVGMMTTDTIYAHQDKAFDIKAGIKSTALAWGDKSKPIFVGLTAVQFASYATAGVLAGMGPGFWGGCAWGFYRIWRMIRDVDLDNVEDCWKHFRSNINTGGIFFLGIWIDYVLRLLGML